MIFNKLFLTWSVMWCVTCCWATVGENAVGRLASRDRLSHGDPCGPTDDPSLVCCHGARQSTLIYRTEECCNGLPVGEGQVCCDWALPVPRASPTHDSCCRDSGSDLTLTYDSHVSFCDRDTWEVMDIPTIGGHLLKLLMSESDPQDYLSESSDPSPMSLLCSAGMDENRSVGPRWRGEEVSCCGLQSYFPSQQTCCGNTRLHDTSSESTLCCNQRAYQKGDPSNPCLATCGHRGQPFNTETDLCCDGVVHLNAYQSVVCCGSDVIDTDTHGCCRDSMPFLKHYMRCGRTGKVERRREGEFSTRKLCRERLPTWMDTWPAPVLADDLLQINGRVLSVTVHRSHHQPQHMQIVLRLNNVINSPDASSLVTSERVNVIAMLGAAHCHSEEQLRTYLNGKALTVLSDLSSLAWTADGVPTVTVPSSSVVHLIILSEVDEQL